MKGSGDNQAIRLRDNAQPGHSLVGVGLRHEHYEKALSTPPQVDFVEVHAENFFMDGGPARSLLAAVGEKHALSLHATSLGLGSFTPVPAKAMRALKQLVDQTNPILISDHAAFCWTGAGETLQHSGDLLPIQFDHKNLKALCGNIDRVQQLLGRQILIENISSYLDFSANPQHEFDFLQQACLATGCGLLLDLNNIFVNLVNAKSVAPLAGIQGVIDNVDGDFVKEIHLAGCELPAGDELMIDDHSQSVPVIIWQAYEYALCKFGRVPTLIEWDTELPSWSRLIAEADKARKPQEEAVAA